MRKTSTTIAPTIAPTIAADFAARLSALTGGVCQFTPDGGGRYIALARWPDPETEDDAPDEMLTLDSRRPQTLEEQLLWELERVAALYVGLRDAARRRVRSEAAA